jgi:hypothetical protein
MPSFLSVLLSAIAVAALPGYIVSAYITNIHNANLVLAGAVNLLLYGSLFLWLASWRDRRKHRRSHSGAANPASDAADDL